MLAPKIQPSHHLIGDSRPHRENLEAAVMLVDQVPLAKSGVEVQRAPVNEILKSEPQTSRSHLVTVSSR
jgi:hypothetical protein